MGRLRHGEPESDGLVSPKNGSAEPRKSPQQWEEEELGQNAYQRRLAEMLDLPKANITVVNLNLTEAIASGLGVLPRVQALSEGLSPRSVSRLAAGLRIDRSRRSGCFQGEFEGNSRGRRDAHSLQATQPRLSGGTLHR